MWVLRVTQRTRATEGTADCADKTGFQGEPQGGKFSQRKQAGGEGLKNP